MKKCPCCGQNPIADTDVLCEMCHLFSVFVIAFMGLIWLMVNQQVVEWGLLWPYMPTIITR